MKLKRVWAQCVKELSQFRRDRLTVALAFLLPFATLLIFGFAIRLETKNIALVVQDFDSSPLSRAYVERLYGTSQLKPVRWSRDWSRNNLARDAINQGKASAAVIIPPDFSRHLKEGKTSTVQVLIDGSDVANARVIKNSVRATNTFFLKTEGFLPKQSLITARTRVWFNPGRQESLYMVPGVLAINLVLYPSILAAIAMVRDKEEGTIVQVYASSASATELLLGKGLAYLLIALSESVFLMLAAALIFGTRLAGDPTPLLVGTPLFLATSVMIGLFVGARSHSQSAAIQAVGATNALTAMLLSGFIYPISNIPWPLSLLANLVPVRYYIELTRDSFVRGTGWPGVWFVFPALAALGLVLFWGAWQKLQRMQFSD
jgi:ABC-2 type transport system permease protein